MLLLSKQDPISGSKGVELVADRRAFVENVSKEVGMSGDYFSYLLRLWREEEGTAVWRASLQDPRTGERVGFAYLDELFEFLRHHVKANASIDKDSSRERRQ